MRHRRFDNILERFHQPRTSPSPANERRDGTIPPSPPERARPPTRTRRSTRHRGTLDAADFHTFAATYRTALSGLVTSADANVCLALDHRTVLSANAITAAPTSPPFRDSAFAASSAPPSIGAPIADNARLGSAARSVARAASPLS